VSLSRIRKEEAVVKLSEQDIQHIIYLCEFSSGGLDEADQKYTDELCARLKGESNMAIAVLNYDDLRAHYLTAQWFPEFDEDDDDDDEELDNLKHSTFIVGPHREVRNAIIYRKIVKQTVLLNDQEVRGFEPLTDVDTDDEDALEEMRNDEDNRFEFLVDSKEILVIQIKPSAKKDDADEKDDKPFRSRKGRR
jgi:hypothetical protein